MLSTVTTVAYMTVTCTWTDGEYTPVWGGPENTSNRALLTVSLETQTTPLQCAWQLIDTDVHSKIISPLNPWRALRPHPPGSIEVHAIEVISIVIFEIDIGTECPVPGLRERGELVTHKTWWVWVTVLLPDRPGYFTAYLQTQTVLSWGSSHPLHRHSPWGCLQRGVCRGLVSLEQGWSKVEWVLSTLFISTHFEPWSFW